MERLKCRACNSMSMVPLEVEADDLDDEAELLGGEQESRFFTCHVCGDNWLSVKLREPLGSTRITFVHQMGMEPVLKRVATLAAPVVVDDRSVQRWDYYLDDDVVAEGEWRELLASRRRILRSICSN